MRLDAYYYSFDATGEIAVDRVLSAVACAGKAFHNTAPWADEEIESPTRYAEHLRGATCNEWIQNAAADAAAEMVRLRTERDEARRERDEALVSLGHAQRFLAAEQEHNAKMGALAREMHTFMGITYPGYCDDDGWGGSWDAVVKALWKRLGLTPATDVYSVLARAEAMRAVCEAADEWASFGGKATPHLPVDQWPKPKLTRAVAALRSLSTPTKEG